MSTREFLAVAARRWYVVAVGLLLTLGVLVAVAQAAGVYWAKTTLVVLTPVTLGEGPNVLTDQSPVSIAALVVMDVNKQPLTVNAGTAEATLYGLGGRRETSVHLRRSGSQWKPSADQPYIDIEAVDDSPEAVRRRLDAAVRDVRATSDRLQSSLGVQPRFRTFLQGSPLKPVVAWVPPSRPRALAGTLLGGLALTGIAVVLTDRVLPSTPKRRHDGKSEKSPHGRAPRLPHPLQPPQ